MGAAAGDTAADAAATEVPAVGLHDRLPDLRVPLADGSPFVLSEDAGGLPVALVVAEEPPAPVAGVLVLHVPLPGGSGDLGSFSLLDDGSIAQALSRGRDVAIVADAAHRVVATGASNDLASLVGRLPTERPAIRRSTSVPLLVVPGVVDAGCRRDLREHMAATGWTPSPMLRADHSGARLDVDDAKARHDIVLDDATLTSTLDAGFQRRLLPEVRRSLGHRITRHEQYKLVRYDAGRGWFEPHRDNTAASATHRVLALTVNLDEVDADGRAPHDGGDLRFPELGPDLWRPEPGAGLVFSCGLLHEVTPVTSGIRHALVTFLF